MRFAKMHPCDTWGLWILKVSKTGLARAYSYSLKVRRGRQSAGFCLLLLAGKKVFSVSRY